MNVPTAAPAEILDVDSHETAPSYLWRELLGEASGQIGERLEEDLRLYEDA